MAPTRAAEPRVGTWVAKTVAYSFSTLTWIDHDEEEGADVTVTLARK